MISTPPLAACLRTCSRTPYRRAISNRFLRPFSGSAIRWSSTSRVAVLYQAVDPPVVNGVRKPKKPGGYQDSGADIAYVLEQNNQAVVTPKDKLDPRSHEGWCFPDSEEGILMAIEKGATHLWANTVLFSSHPLQTSSALNKYASEVRVVGQPPNLVDAYDDKNWLNDMLRKDNRFLFPRAWVVDSAESPTLSELSYPVVAKPIRGRGSHGVKVCRSRDALVSHLKTLIEESPLVMIEDYLAGQEGTVTVMPPSKQNPHHWAMPTVVRFNHEDGVAPYNGIVAVTQNSRAISEDEMKATNTFRDIQEQCELVAERLKVTAPIRIDVRRIDESDDARFALFDINMKPNMTGPGRPGREDQASLTALAADRLGWNYTTLLQRILETAQPLQHLRSLRINDIKY